VERKGVISVVRRTSRLSLTCLGCALLALAMAAACFARPGSPSKGFGQNGIVALRADSSLRDVAPQSGGRVLVTGVSGRQAGKARLLVQRLTKSGRPDPKFHHGKPYLGPVGSVGNALAVLRDGSILVAGTLTDRRGGGQAGLLAIRLRPNGSPDRSFGGDGRVTSFGKTRGQGLAIASRGRGGVLVGGSSTPLDRSDGFDRVAVAAFKSNGRPDRHFGRRGVSVLDLGRISAAEDLAVRGDGKIVLAGSQRDNLQTTQVLAARLRANGSLDRRFGSRGAFIKQYAQGAAFSAFRALALGNGGRVLLAGTALTSAQGPEALVVELGAGGNPVGGFGRHGAVYLPASQNRDQHDQNHLAGAYGVSLSGGDIVLGGFHDRLGLKDLALWALRSGGAVDKRFGSKGHVFRQYRESSSLAGVAAAGRYVLGAGETGSLLSDATTGIVARYVGPAR
jgi:uncharacterized delta-60 repeat protein